MQDMPGQATMKFVAKSQVDEAGLERHGDVPED